MNNFWPGAHIVPPSSPWIRHCRPICFYFRGWTYETLLAHLPLATPKSNFMGVWGVDVTHTGKNLDPSLIFICFFRRKNSQYTLKPFPLLPVGFTICFAHFNSEQNWSLGTSSLASSRAGNALLSQATSRNLEIKFLRFTNYWKYSLSCQTTNQLVLSLPIILNFVLLFS